MPSYYDSSSDKPKGTKIRKYRGGGSVNSLIDHKYGHGGRVKHNPSTINP